MYHQLLTFLHILTRKKQKKRQHLLYIHNTYQKLFSPTNLPTNQDFIIITQSLPQ